MNIAFNAPGVIASTSHGYGYKSAFTFVITFGILGNILVILSILLRQRRLLKNKFYYLLFHVTICDLSYLLLSVFHVYVILAGKKLNYQSRSVCIAFRFFRELFLIFGAYFLLFISIIRYRAVLHPLTPSISYGRLKVLSCFVYILSLLISCPIIYFCVSEYLSSFSQAYEIMVQCVMTFIWYFLPVTIMAVIYWKICRELIKQNNAMKSTNSSPSNCGKVKRLVHHRNWRTFLVSLATVVCFAVAGLPRHVGGFLFATDLDSHRLHLLLDYGWVIQAAGTCAINPLIYGILDKKLLLSFFKLFQMKQANSVKPE